MSLNPSQPILFACVSEIALPEFTGSEILPADSQGWFLEIPRNIAFLFLKEKSSGHTLGEIVVLPHSYSSQCHKYETNFLSPRGMIDRRPLSPDHEYHNTPIRFGKALVEGMRDPTELKPIHPHQTLWPHTDEWLNLFGQISTLVPNEPHSVVLHTSAGTFQVINDPLLGCLAGHHAVEKISRASPGKTDYDKLINQFIRCTPPDIICPEDPGCPLLHVCFTQASPSY